MHYRRTSAICQALVRQAEAAARRHRRGRGTVRAVPRLRAGLDDPRRHRHYRALVRQRAMRRPFRDHPRATTSSRTTSMPGTTRRAATVAPSRPTRGASTDDYPEVSSSALWFAVQLTPGRPARQAAPVAALRRSRHPQGAAGCRRRDADVACRRHRRRAYRDVRRPTRIREIYQGDAYQTADRRGQTDPDRPVRHWPWPGPAVPGAARRHRPAAAVRVPTGFPLPWEVAHRLPADDHAYKLFFNGGWELPKPRVPDFIIVPPHPTSRTCSSRRTSPA